MDLNSLGDDVLKLLSNGDGSCSTVASSEYKLRATVCVFPYYIGSFCVYITSLVEFMCLSISQVLKAPHGDLLTCMEMAKA